MKKDRNRSIEYAKDYCRGCIEFDTPRLAKETFPDGVAVEDVCEEYEVYVPGGMKKEDEAFILVHGGAFVYGSRRLDKRFGMFLAMRSSMRVFNVYYRLIPEVGIIDQLSDIMAAAGKISRKYDIRKFHLVGDSAGGYLSFATALLMHSREMRDELGIKMDDGISVLSASPICGCYRLNDVEFPGSLFEEGEETKLPDYIYDLTKAPAKFGFPRTLVVTGDHDFLLKDNVEMREVLKAIDPETVYYEAKSSEDRMMRHVFPIFAPDWEESSEAIDLMVKNAEG